MCPRQWFIDFEEGWITISKLGFVNMARGFLLLYGVL